MEKLEIKQSDLIIETDFDKRTREKSRQLQQFRRFITLKTSNGSVRNYLGIEDAFSVRGWIEGLFSNGMTWDNYGEFWVVDHIVPLRLFDIFDEIELNICWNYRNLMPLLKDDNLKKEGNVFFAIELLYPIRNKDIFYNKLFERVKPECEWMLKYIDTYADKNY